MQNNLVLPNTLFPHKMTHKTTWTSHERVEDHLSFNRTSSVKTCTKSFCRNQDHVVEQERKLIKNWLKLLLNKTGGAPVNGTPFTPEEIQKASQKLKNNKVTGPEGVHAEYLKYGSNQLFVNTSDIWTRLVKQGITRICLPWNRQPPSKATRKE